MKYTPRRCYALALALLALALAYLANRPGVELETDRTLPFHYDDSEQAWLDSRKMLSELNATLDFGRVYVINMAHRTDRREQIVRMANVSGMDVHFAPGFRVVSREQTLTDEFPPYEPKEMPLSKLGVYKAHSNVWKDFLASMSAETAMILEDDVDWDVDVKDVLARLRYPLRALVRRMTDDRTSSSLSWNAEQWDVLRLGTCREPAFREDFKPDSVDLDAMPYVTYVDPTVPLYEWIVTDSRMVMDAYHVPMPSLHDDRIEPRYRLVKRSNYPVCMHAYAVSRAGAAKLVEITAKGLIDGANDLTVAEATQEGHLRSFSILPPPFNQWKVQGWTGNTDNGGTNIDPLIDEKGPKAFTWNLRQSVRASILE